MREVHFYLPFIEGRHCREQETLRARITNELGRWYTTVPRVFLTVASKPDHPRITCRTDGELSKEATSEISAILIGDYPGKDINFVDSNRRADEPPYYIRRGATSKPAASVEAAA